MNPYQTTYPTADWTWEIRPSMLYRLARLFGTNPDLISFAGGAPDPNLFPRKEIIDAAVRIMTENPQALQYGRDLPALKEAGNSVAAAFQSTMDGWFE